MIVEDEEQFDLDDQQDQRVLILTPEKMIKALTDAVNSYLYIGPTELATKHKISLFNINNYLNHLYLKFEIPGRSKNSLNSLRSLYQNQSDQVKLAIVEISGKVNTQGALGRQHFVAQHPVPLVSKQTLATNALAADAAATAAAIAAASLIPISHSHSIIIPIDGTQDDNRLFIPENVENLFLFVTLAGNSSCLKYDGPFFLSLSTSTMVLYCIFFVFISLSLTLYPLIFKFLSYF